MLTEFKLYKPDFPSLLLKFKQALFAPSGGGKTFLLLNILEKEFHNNPDLKI